MAVPSSAAYAGLGNGMAWGGVISRERLPLYEVAPENAYRTETRSKRWVHSEAQVARS